MTRSELSRRAFLRQGAVYGSGALLAWSLSRPRAVAAAEEGDAPSALTRGEWRTLEAASARILPTDADPGAREAGCANFIDKALAHEDAAALPLYRAGLAGLDAVARRRAQKPFAELEEAEQDAVLVAIEDGAAAGWPAAAPPSPVFFETLRAQTVIGFLADPRYGGNRDYAGWRCVGYPGPRHHSGGYSDDQVSGKAPLPTAWGEKL